MARHAFAHTDTVTLCRRGLDLVAALPPGEPRDDHESRFLDRLAVALYPAGGFPPDASTMFERATTLRRQLGRPVDPGVLRVSCNLNISGRRYPEAERLGWELLAVGESTGDALAVTEGHYVVGVTTFWQGKLPESRDHLRMAIDTYRPERSSQHVEIYTQDPKAVCLTRLAFTTWHLGDTEEAEALGAEAVAYAHHVGHRYTLDYVRLFEAWRLTDTGDYGRAARYASEIDEEPKASWVGSAATMFMGWAQVMNGDLNDGITTLEEALAAVRNISDMYEPYALTLLACAYGRAGEAEKAVERASLACDIAEREMRYFEPHAHCVLGEIIAAAGGPLDEVERHLRYALVRAQEQRAVMLELQARTSLLRWVPADRAAADGR